ncbi:MAG: hypothetical protein FH752_11505 [Marinobacter adhaerens]|uniref:Uncharacterized protein n=1 Tax=Marinobacter adhaerens TaxID=1033846 RepID=A0A844I5K0_9GAMM|nr:hypothetical protein [Marinobacter adhaerens]
MGHVRFHPFGLVSGFNYGPSLVDLGAGRGEGIFSLGKNNSLRSDIFFLSGKNSFPPSVEPLWHRIRKTN